MTQVKVILTGDESRLLRSLDRVIQKETKLRDAQRKSGEASTQASDKASKGFKSVSDSRDKAFGSQAVNQLQSYLTTLVGTTAILSQIKAGWDAVDQAREKAAQSLRESEMGMSQLAQLAGGDRTQLQMLTRIARDIYGRGGAGSLDEAARTTFALGSAGALKDYRFFGDLYGIIQQPDIMARAATTLRTSIGEEETGGLRGIVSKAFAASKYSPAQAEELLESAATAGPAVRGLGGTDEELLGATAVMATALGSASEGGTAVRSLLMSLQKKGDYKGLGVVGSIQKLMKGGQTDEMIFKRFGGRQAVGEYVDYMSSITDGDFTMEKFLNMHRMPMSDAQMIEYLGRKEAFTAYDILKRNIPMIQEIAEAATTAQETGLIDRIIKSRELIPEIQVARRERMLKAERENVNVQRGMERINTEQMITEIGMEHEMGGGSELIGALGEKGMRSARYLLGDETAYNLYRKSGALDVVKRNIRSPFDWTIMLKALTEAIIVGQREASSGKTLSNPDQDPGRPITEK